MSDKTEPKKCGRILNRTLRFRKNDPAHNLLAATQAWLRSEDGSALIIGGIGIIEAGWGEPDLNFYVAVKVTGRRPKKKEAKP